jgi:cytochrome b pre-mRNA-processing protein 3
MLGWLRRRSEATRIAPQLYGRIVTAARDERLYVSCGVPDTMDGRLEMVLLHVVLVLDRLKGEGARGQRLGQRLMECMIADLDDALRRIGLGDDSIAVRVPKLGAALRERARDYGAALEEEAPALPTSRGLLESALAEHALRRTGGESQADPEVARLADYVRACRAKLALTAGHDMLAGRLELPSPAS